MAIWTANVCNSCAIVLTCSAAPRLVTRAIDLHRVLGVVPVPLTGMSSGTDADDLPPCLCGIDVLATAVQAGYVLADAHWQEAYKTPLVLRRAVSPGELAHSLGQPAASRARN